MAFEIAVSQELGRVLVTVLKPRGELDASNYQDLIAEARKVYDEGARDILLDLGDVSYMSSSGLVALQSMAKLLRGEELPDLESGWAAIRTIDRDRDTGVQAHFKLLNPQPRVDSVLETVGLKRYLEIFSDLESALAAF